MVRTRIVLVVALSALLLMAVPAFAQYPPEDAEAEVTVSTTTVAPGGTITVVGEDFLPGSQVNITLVETTEVLGTVTVRADGTFSTNVTLPADLAPGTYTLRVSGVDADGEPRVIDTTITVVAAAAAPAPGTGLAATGGQFTVGSALAALLLVIGGGALFASRRLRRVSV